jgi:transcriptional regulator with XRE-family HTH domain
LSQNKRRNNKRKLFHKPFLKLKGRIIEKGFTQGTLASAIGIADSTLSEKINGLADFDQSELIKIIDLLEIEDSEIYGYFFDKVLRVS